MPAEGTGTANPNPLDAMSIVTYRGVKYDTEAYKARPHETKVFHETYRGIKHDEKVEVVK